MHTYACSYRARLHDFLGKLYKSLGYKERTVLRTIELFVRVRERIEIFLHARVRHARIIDFVIAVIKIPR